MSWEGISPPRRLESMAHRPRKTWQLGLPSWRVVRG
jgi:hypothetical protein